MPRWLSLTPIAWALRASGPAEVFTLEQSGWRRVGPSDGVAMIRVEDSPARRLVATSGRDELLSVPLGGGMQVLSKAVASGAVFLTLQAGPSGGEEGGCGLQIETPSTADTFLKCIRQCISAAGGGDDHGKTAVGPPPPAEEEAVRPSVSTGHLIGTPMGQAEMAEAAAALAVVREEPATEEEMPAADVDGAKPEGAAEQWRCVRPQPSNSGTPAAVTAR